MATTNSDKAWEEYGQKDPYFGVLTHEKYKNKNINAEHKKEFFYTGTKFAKRVFKQIRQHYDPNFIANSVLDFGCGTGRLALGFAPTSKRVVGIDISQSMLAEAKTNAKEQGYSHLEFYQSDDNLSAVANEQFDLVNCYIVLQHINPKRGLNIIQQLVNRIKPGGYGVLQLIYTCQKGRRGKVINYFRYRIPVLHGVLNLINKRPFDEPLMQMNSYDLNKISYILQKSGVKNVFQQYEDHGGCLGLTLFFHKPKN